MAAAGRAAVAALMLGSVPADNAVAAQQAHLSKTNEFPRLSDAVDARGILRESQLKFRSLLAKYPDAFSGRNPEILKEALGYMNAVTHSSMKGTNLDFNGIPAGTVVFSNEKGHGSAAVLWFYDRPNPEQGLVKRYVLVTPRHVHHLAILPKGKVWKHYVTRAEGEVDLSLSELTEEEARALSSKALFLDQKVKNRNLTGEIMTVLSIDLDRSADGSKYTFKQIPSLVSPLLQQPGMPESAIATVNWKSKIDPKQAALLRAITIPVSELEKDHNQAYSIQGVSGSTLVYVPEKAQGVHFGGMLVSAGSLTVNGTTFANAEIIDAQVVWKAIESTLGNARASD